MSAIPGRPSGGGADGRILGETGMAGWYGDARARDREIAAAANKLAVRWARRVGRRESTVFSSLGVWPLLGLLASGAQGRTHEELSAAFALPAHDAAQAVRELFDRIERTTQIQAALGLWCAPRLQPHRSWLDAVPEDVVEQLTGDLRADQDRLDAWARKKTAGRIDAMPCELDESVVLVLATAIALETVWPDPFREERGAVEGGPWAGSPLALLRRETSGSHDVSVADTACGPVTLTRVTGLGDFDVYLMIGDEGAEPCDVLATGLAAAGGAHEPVWVDEWADEQPPPGATVTRVLASAPQVRLTCVPFDIRAKHDLLAEAETFGLETASSPKRARFPGISSTGVFVSAAEQNTRAQFTARGFAAAAVTVGTASPAGMMVPRQVTRTDVSYTRPHGFAAVLRESGLILAAGWVAQPDAAASARSTQSTTPRTL